MLQKMITLKPGREKPILAGHPWIFSMGIEKDAEAERGELVEVQTSEGRFLGVGTYSPGNSIRVRIISREKLEKLDKDFFVGRLLALDKLKREFLPEGTNGYRIVHADADYLPGLILDKYNDVFVFQAHTAGMDIVKLELIEAIKEVFSPRGIVERSDLEIRKMEGLEHIKPMIHFGEIDGLVMFEESGIKFFVEVLAGQKTGFFLDQREARRKIGELSKGKKVLNLFSYTGAFGLYSALAGAEKVTTVDISAKAVEMAKENFKLNGLDLGSDKYDFVVADVFDFLNSPAAKGYDLIVCDPPAFAKAGARVEQALWAYTDLSKKCLELLKQGGILLASSCSGRVSMDEFRSVLRIAGGKSGRDVRVLASLGQALDHTDRLCFIEGRYLKTLIVEVL
ncbi:MAG: class I SAM-dependent rRNA methyltransferase [Patescibacteria group bacterium]